MAETLLIEQIRTGDKKALKKIYTENKAAFISFMISRYQTNAEDALEIYQFAILRFYDNVVYGKLTHLSSTLKSYLFAIGKNIWREQVRIKQREKTMLSSNQLLLQTIVHADQPQMDKHQLQSKEHYLQKITYLLQQMGNPCKAILEYFYYEKRSMLEIATALNFKNTNVAKTKKNKCLNRLKRLATTEKIVPVNE